VAVVDPDWRLDGTHLCARKLAGRRTCRRDSVAALNRHQRRHGRTVDAWWPYCERHLYGRWIENGQVMCWILRKIGGEDA
jgi:hypothetical protein